MAIIRRDLNEGCVLSLTPPFSLLSPSLSCLPHCCEVRALLDHIFYRCDVLLHPRHKSHRTSHSWAEASATRNPNKPFLHKAWHGGGYQYFVTVREKLSDTPDLFDYKAESCGGLSSSPPSLPTVLVHHGSFL